MGLGIPAGTRAGARPCGATWAGSHQFVYCTKCWAAYQLENGTKP